MEVYDSAGGTVTSLEVPLSLTWADPAVANGDMNATTNLALSVVSEMGDALLLGEPNAVYSLVATATSVLGISDAADATAQQEADRVSVCAGLFAGLIGTISAGTTATDAGLVAALSTNVSFPPTELSNLAQREAAHLMGAVCDILAVSAVGANASAASGAAASTLSNVFEGAAAGTANASATGQAVDSASAATASLGNFLLSGTVPPETHAEVTPQFGIRVWSQEESSLPNETLAFSADAQENGSYVSFPENFTAGHGVGSVSVQMVLYTNNPRSYSSSAATICSGANGSQTCEDGVASPMMTVTIYDSDGNEVVVSGLGRRLDTASETSGGHGRQQGIRLGFPYTTPKAALSDTACDNGPTQACQAKADDYARQMLSLGPECQRLADKVVFNRNKDEFDVCYNQMLKINQS